MGKIVRPKIQELPRSIDRWTFCYLDQCYIHVDGGSIMAKRNDDRTLVIPSASCMAIILGPGATVTHDAVKLLGGTGTAVIWMGADQTRFYASGRPLSESAKLIEAQAKIVSNQRLRMACAKKMYGIRFPGIDAASRTTMNSLRGMEGNRMKTIYKDNEERTGVKWHGRYTELDLIENIDTGSKTVNKAITIGNQVLYAVCYAVCSAVGLSPALGVIHCKHQGSFIYDLSDLYKGKTTIPIGFDVAKELGDDYPDLDRISRETRKRLRRKFKEIRLLKQMSQDIKYLFEDNDDEEKSSSIESFLPDEIIWADEETGLWDSNGVLPGGINYALQQEIAS